MKKIFFVFLFCTALTTLKAQLVLDVLPMVQNIETNKTLYIGHPFSYLLSSLNIPIQYFSPIYANFSRKNDETSTHFAFYFPTDESQLYLAYPRLQIYWQTALDGSASMALYKANNRGKWLANAQAFYNDAIITDIKVSQ